MYFLFSFFIDIECKSIKIGIDLYFLKNEIFFNSDIPLLSDHRYCSKGNLAIHVCWYEFNLLALVILYFRLRWFYPRKLTFTRLACVLCLLFRLFCKQNVQLKTINIETPENNVVVSIILWRKKHTQQSNLPLHESNFFFQLFTLFSRRISRSR